MGVGGSSAEPRVRRLGSGEGGARKWAMVVTEDAAFNAHEGGGAGSRRKTRRWTLLPLGTALYRPGKKMTG